MFSCGRFQFDAFLVGGFLSKVAARPRRWPRRGVPNLCHGGRRFQLVRRGRGRWRLLDRAAAEEGIGREESSHKVRGREDRLGSSRCRRRTTRTSTCQEAGVHALRLHRRKGGRRRWGGRGGGGGQRRQDAHHGRSALLGSEWRVVVHERRRQGQVAVVHGLVRRGDPQLVGEPPITQGGGGGRRRRCSFSRRRRHRLRDEGRP